MPPDILFISKLPQRLSFWETPRRCGIDNIVRGKFFSLNLSGCGQAISRHPAPFVKGSALMRIFAVTKIRNLLEIHEDIWRQIDVVADPRKVLRDLRIISGGF